MTTATEELEDREVAEATDETEPEATEQAEPGNGEQVTNSTPAEIPPEPPADCPAHIREHYEAIREKERDVYALESKYLALKEQASSAKKDFESADKELRNLIARGADRQKQLPFSKTDQRRPKSIKLLADIPGTTMKAGYEPPIAIDDQGRVLAIFNDGTKDDQIVLDSSEYEVIEWVDDTAAAEVADESWRSAPFAELGLTEKQNDLFASIGVTTIGELEDLRARIAEGKSDAQWPKGIGPAKVTDIENRIVSWLDKNRDKFGEPVQAAEAATDVEVPAATDAEPIIPEPEDEHEQTAGRLFPDSNGKAKSPAKAKSNGKAKHKANGKAKAKKKGRR